MARTDQSFGLRLRRLTGRRFDIEARPDSLPDGLGEPIGGYVAEAENDPKWWLFSEGVWSPSQGRALKFSEVSEIIPNELRGDFKLLQFNPALMVADQPPLNLECVGRDGWAVWNVIKELIERSGTPFRDLHRRFQSPSTNPRPDTSR